MWTVLVSNISLKSESPLAQGPWTRMGMWRDRGYLAWEVGISHFITNINELLDAKSLTIEFVFAKIKKLSLFVVCKLINKMEIQETLILCFFIRYRFFNY